MGSSEAAPSALVDFLAGTAGGVASLLAGHPFDTVKTRLQTQPALSSGSIRLALDGAPHTPVYRSATDAFRVIVREEKLVGLYKGVTGPLLGVAAMNSCLFTAYGLALRVQLQGSGADGSLSLGDVRQPSLAQVFLAGAASGLVTALITTPIELVKIREQLDVRASASARPSTLQVVRAIWAQHGVRGLYRGFGVTCLRDIGYGPYFWSYEAMNRLLLSQRHGLPSSSGDGGLSNVELALSGAAAGVVAWLSTFWADVLKTRVQASAAPPGVSGTLRAEAAAVWAEGGVPAFFKGVGPTLLRAIPANAALFLTYELVRGSLAAQGL